MIAFSLFLIATTPQKLAAARAKARKENVKLTARFIKEFGKSSPKPDEDSDADDNSDDDSDADKRLSQRDRAKLLTDCKQIEDELYGVVALLEPTNVSAPPKKKAA